MSETMTFRCERYTIFRVRCTADATHRLLYDGEDRIQLYCEEHAHETIREYSEQEELGWSLEPLNPQAARITELEGRLRGKCAQHRGGVRALGKVMGELTEARERITELEAELQAFRAFNAPLLRTIAEEEPGAWDHLQEGHDGDTP